MVAQMRSNIKIDVNLEPLKKLAQNLKTSYIVKVGLIGAKGSSTHKDSGLSNAEIGAIHEFGSLSDKIPRRSFLQDTFFYKKDDLVKQVGQIIEAGLAFEMTTEQVRKIYKLIGVYGEALVQEAFETGGFGKWKPLSQETINNKGSSSILIDTGEMRKKITSRIDKA